jgi:hypothetical protein
MAAGVEAGGTVPELRTAAGLLLNAQSAGQKRSFPENLFLFARPAGGDVFLFRNYNPSSSHRKNKVLLENAATQTNR